MNSEELELSLRTEFDNYLKGVLAGIRQDVSDFQKNFEAEFEKHKAQLDGAVRDLSARFESDASFDQAFTESVTEHLRLARDEGALITATAFSEAEKMAEKASAPASNFDQLRDAINEVSSKTSQSEILRSLVEHAANFTPRGAFFIVKNEQFVGWKVFGKEGNVDEAAVREIQFPVDAETVLADAANSLSARESSFGGHKDDALFLEPLSFGRPDRMYAIPLTARGRGVAVLYADYGVEGVSLNAEALETLVRVAGLTVELLAASQLTPAAYSAPAAEDVKAEEPTAMHAAIPAYQEPAAEGEEYAAAEFVEADAPAAVFEEEEAAVETPVEVEEYVGAVSFDEPVQEDVVPTTAFEIAAVEPESAATESYFETFQPVEEPQEIVEEKEAYYAEAVEEVVPVEEPQVEDTVSAIEEPAYGEISDLGAAPDEEVETVEAVTAFEEEPVAPVADYAPQQFEDTNGTPANAFQAAALPVVEVATAKPARSRFSDRNVDLPIEVAEDERRLHNDARRFARLLVSEIKLYNEQKVTEGRDSQDLYDRLREAIDRSRDMYDKRVQPPVASKFDYFHYELVSSLAEGEDAKLGANYPGAHV